MLSVSAPAAPVVLKHRAGLAKGLKYAVLVANNVVSLRAVKLVQSLLRGQDRLFIVHFVRDREEIKAACVGFLHQYEVCTLWSGQAGACICLVVCLCFGICGRTSLSIGLNCGSCCRGGIPASSLHPAAMCV